MLFQGNYIPWTQYKRMLFIMEEKCTVIYCRVWQLSKKSCVFFKVNFERHFWIDTPMFSQVFSFEILKMNWNFVSGGWHGHCGGGHFTIGEICHHQRGPWGNSFLYSQFIIQWKKSFNTLPTTEILSGQNTLEWVSMVSYLKI